MVGIKTNIIKLVGAAALSFAVPTAWAFDAFTIERIQVQGLQGVSYGTVMSYLPIKAGQRLDESHSAEIIQHLYNTGFFQTVSLGRTGNTLIISVKELPTIGRILIHGNTSVKSDKIKSVLKQLGFIEGRPYNQTALAKIRYSLQHEYDNLSKYSASITTQVTQLPRNRVSVTFNIVEGQTAKIARIQIVGNHAFDQRTLLKQLKLSTPNLFTIFTHNDQYTEEKLLADLQSLNDFYLNHGYIQFRVLAHNAKFSADKKQVFITIDVQEGMQYRLSGYDVTGKFIVPKAELTEKVSLPVNQPFSRKAVLQAQQSMAEVLGKQGYAFAEIQVIPRIDETNKTVYLTFVINPGRQAYVRYIHFKGNVKTADRALRAPMQQMEGGMVNTQKIQESVRNLNMLGFVKNVEYRIVPVPGSNNQVDLDMNVTEMPLATVTAGAGYSTALKFIVSAGLSQKNFLGTGKSFSVNFETSSLVRSYSVSFNDPYYTVDGVSQGFSLYAQKYNPGKIGLTSSYVYDIYGGSLDYGIPIDNYNRINFSGGLQRINLRTGSTPPALLTNFVNRYGRRFNEVVLSSSWLLNTWDRAIFPTRGIEQSIGGTLTLPADHRSLKYYKIDYLLQGYLPLTSSSSSFILMGRGGVGYGNGLGSTNALPFFANYFGGGIDTNIPIAGIDANSLGPKDEFGDPVGGNFGAYGTVGLILPEFNESIRTMVFVDGANLFNTRQTPARLGTLRYSTGVQLAWQSPIGPLVFSVATPIRKFAGDTTQIFQFTFGTNF